MYPHKIYICLLCQRHQFLLMQFIDADLGDFCQIDITCMDVQTKV